MHGVEVKVASFTYPVDFIIVEDVPIVERLGVKALSTVIMNFEIDGI